MLISSLWCETHQFPRLPLMMKCHVVTPQRALRNTLVGDSLLSLSDELQVRRNTG
jgi:hypothetical protein